VFALLFGNLLLGEELTSIQWAGVGLTLVSIYLINQRDVLSTPGQHLASDDELSVGSDTLAPSLVDLTEDLKS
jgi:hypothetical protein